MHELSVVQSIVDIAEEEVKKRGAHTVDSIELEIGTQAGVEFDALDFAWDVGVQRTILQEAERKINRIQAIARCSCGCEYPVMEPFEPCPACHEVLVEYIQGKELKVKSLVIS